MNPLNARVIATLYADCPPSFEEQVDGRMAYVDNGEEGFYVERVWLENAAEDYPTFKDTTIYAELTALFAAFPDHQDAILSYP